MPFFYDFSTVLLKLDGEHPLLDLKNLLKVPISMNPKWLAIWETSQSL